MSGRGAGGAGGAAAGQEERARLCTVLVDVRGLGLSRDISSLIYDTAGRQLWPDAELIKGVSSQQVNEGNLQSYRTGEPSPSDYPNPTQVRARSVQPNRISPNSPYKTDAVLDAANAVLFRSAGSACRVVYLTDPDRK